MCQEPRTTTMSNIGLIATPTPAVAARRALLAVTSG
jgi:hypothetical protein